ncbi:G-protein coupled receptor 52-like isoform X2 [Linepithema humile]|uniref:G-protein coupled receptor 52-like isoform X2 n=1 Tax=Linepithema humile TaxID=83485 RepID=UPI0006231DC7|nr:PREDICTED: galanin receptor type 3-like isoform X2 [Linepithema humile]
MGPWAFVLLILVSALGLFLNGYVLLVLGLGKQTQQQQTANTLLLIHLGAVEAAVCLILLIFTTGSWPFADTWCVLHGFLLALLHPVALWTVTGLNCDRYYAIAAPLHYAALVSPRRVVVGLVASWTGALLLCLPPFSGLVPPYKYNPGLGCCAPDFGNGAWGTAAALYGAVYAILSLGLPAILVTVCNLRVLGIARYHRHRIASAIYEVTLSAQVTITHQRNPFFVPTVTAPSAGGPPRFHSAASTVMQLVGSLYLLYFPYCGLILWEACSAGNQPRHHAYPRLAESLASLLLACSPPINGLLYGLKSQTLRRSVQNYWRKKATKSELQQEIQARTPSVAGSRRPSGSGNASFFPFPPLQRRLSETLLALGSYRTGSSFESNNFGFQRGRLQPAASCNTLRVPTTESERRWRHCSIGSESSTESSDASVWTTGVAPKYVKGNAKNSADGWSSRRGAHDENLEEGALSTAVRPNNNSESSDTTTDTTTATTTTTLLKSLAIENGGQNKRDKEKINGNTKKGEYSESESSWSSVEEIETKAVTERDDEDDNLERAKEELQTRLPRRKSKSGNCEPEVAEDREEAAQLRPLLTSSS